MLLCGLLRCTGANPWPFLHWPDCQQQQWRQLVQAAEQAAADGRKAWRAGGGRILGNDCHAVSRVWNPLNYLMLHL
jgi:hypothetical protein